MKTGYLICLGIILIILLFCMIYSKKKSDTSTKWIPYLIGAALG